jgi:two-component system OmpR family sensor kinase
MRGVKIGQWSVRARLIVGVGALVAVALLITAGTSVVLMRTYLTNQLDSQLSVVSGRVLEHAEVGSPAAGLPPSTSNGQLPTPYFLTVLNANGGVLGQVGGSDVTDQSRPDFSSLTAARVRSLGNHASTIPSVDGSDGYRIRAVARSDGTSAVLAISLHSVDSAVSRLILTALLTALAALILVLLLSALVVRLGMRPLVDMQATSEVISRGDLSQRLPVTSTGTEVGRLGASFNTMLERIEAAFAEKEHSEQLLRQFVADAGHELRTPLATIRGYAELARTGALADDTAYEQAHVRIEAEAARMGVLVDDLLLLARLDQHRPLNPIQVDIDAVAMDAVADAQIRDPDREITYSAPADAAIAYVDSDRIRQVITNLLSNALVHTTPGTPVHVQVESTTGGEIRIIVRDHGPGVTPEAAAHLFQRFYRVDASRTRSRGGSGLGLAIVESVVTASGGTVTCESSPQDGSTFTVTLPAATTTA